MGKQKQKNRRPDEALLGENRLYKKQLKKLNQEIRRLHKEIAYNQNKSGEPRITVKEDHIPKCPNCGKGDLLIMDLGNRRYNICHLCDYRERTS
jgi:predicted  nucleic acid-binding Zn-ribbon protein